MIYCVSLDILKWDYIYDHRPCNMALIEKYKCKYELMKLLIKFMCHFSNIHNLIFKMYNLILNICKNIIKTFFIKTINSIQQ